MSTLTIDSSKTRTIYGLHGILTVEADGWVITRPAEADHAYRHIQRVDLREFFDWVSGAFRHALGDVVADQTIRSIEIGASIDILALGLWDECGAYTPPEATFRDEWIASLTTQSPRRTDDPRV